jgi:hypothetical protein
MGMVASLVCRTAGRDARLFDPVQRLIHGFQVKRFRIEGAADPPAILAMFRVDVLPALKDGASRRFFGDTGRATARACRGHPHAALCAGRGPECVAPS